MVYVFHGEDTVASRKALIDLRSIYDSDAIFEFSDQSLSEFVRVADGLGLFSPKKLVVVEIFKQTSLKEVDYLPYLEKKPKTTEVVFWIGEELPDASPLSKMVLKNGWKIRKFSSFNRNHVFKFVDCLFFRDRKGALNCLPALINSGENLFGIMSLVASRARQLLWLKTSALSGRGIKPFVRSKLTGQVGAFSQKDLIGVLCECSRVDLETKTGNLDPSLGIVEIIRKVC